MDELNKWEQTRPDLSKITAEERRLIDDAVAAGRVTRVPTGASAFNREYVWASGYRGSMELRPVGVDPTRKPGYVWRREIAEDGRLAAARGKRRPVR